MSKFESNEELQDSNESIRVSCPDAVVNNSVKSKLTEPVNVARVEFLVSNDAV